MNDKIVKPLTDSQIYDIVEAEDNRFIQPTPEQKIESASRLNTMRQIRDWLKDEAPSVLNPRMKWANYEMPHCGQTLLDNLESEITDLEASK